MHRRTEPLLHIAVEVERALVDRLHLAPHRLHALEAMLRDVGADDRSARGEAADRRRILPDAHASPRRLMSDAIRFYEQFRRLARDPELADAADRCRRELASLLS